MVTKCAGKDNGAQEEDGVVQGPKLQKANTNHFIQTQMAVNRVIGFHKKYLNWAGNAQFHLTTDVERHIMEECAGKDNGAQKKGGVEPNFKKRKPKQNSQTQTVVLLSQMTPQYQALQLQFIQLVAKNHLMVSVDQTMIIQSVCIITADIMVSVVQ